MALLLRQVPRPEQDAELVRVQVAAAELIAQHPVARGVTVGQTIKTSAGTFTVEKFLTEDDVAELHKKAKAARAARAKALAEAPHESAEDLLKRIAADDAKRRITERRAAKKKAPRRRKPKAK